MRGENRVSPVEARPNKPLKKLEKDFGKTKKRSYLSCKQWQHKTQVGMCMRLYCSILSII